jgi:hypothetical protein
MRSWREPDAGDPHVRFAERRLETELWEGLRHRHEAKAAGNSDSPFPMATAPVVDSTGGRGRGCVRGKPEPVWRPDVPFPGWLRAAQNFSPVLDGLVECRQRCLQA